MSSIEFADNKPLTEDEIQAAAVSELDTELRYLDDQLQENWRHAYAYYKGAAPGPSPARTSESVSTDVSDVIEWILPAVLKPLIESPDVVRFDPVSPEDQGQADLESDYVHHTFMKKCNGFLKLYCHIKDALLLKNAIFATYWDEGITNRVEDYENLTEVELADLLSPADGSEVRVISSETHEEPILDPLTGLPVQQEAPLPLSGPSGSSGGPKSPHPLPATRKLYDVSVRRFTPHGRPIVENCQPEAFRVRMNHNSIDLTDCSYCVYTVTKTRAELYSEGFDKDLVDEIPIGTGRYWVNETRWAREDVERDSNSLSRDENETGDPSQDLVDVHRVYMILDADGDGYGEQYLILLGGLQGQVMLDYYEVPENPFSASTPFIAAHKFYGYSLFDKIKNLADQKTRVLRMLEDNLDLLNNPRKKAIPGMANLDDLLVQQVGGIWRMDTMDAVQEIPTPNIAQNGFALMEYYDKQRGERSGIDPNAQSISKMMPEESMNAAMERVISAKEELVGLIIRVFAETGVKDMFCKLRGLMLRNMRRGELVQLRNKWTKVNPGNWVERTDTTIKVGLGTGDRIKKTQGLMNVFGLQKELIQQGMLGLLMSPERISHTLAELIRVQGLGDPDDFLLDPALLNPKNPNSHTPRGREAFRAATLQTAREQQAAKEKQAQAQAQAQVQQQLLAAQKEIAALQAQAKTNEAQIQAQSRTQVELIKSRQDMLDRQAEMLQFREEQRRLWAELGVKSTVEETKVAANVASTLIGKSGGNGEDSA